MTVHILDALAREGFEEVVALSDRESGLRAFLALHDTTRGPAFGGIRRWAYRDEGEALRDCLRLARAMSRKCALLDLPAGGAKLVVLDGPALDLEAGYAFLGRVVERLGGRFETGPDVGTGPAELAAVAAHTRHVTDPGGAGPGELPEATAEGVFRGIEASLEHLDGAADWSARTVVVQGLGATGRLLAARLCAAGARVRASELDPRRAEAAAAELGLELLAPGSELDAACDVFAPCALGGLLHDVTLGRLRCRAVAGSANNVLAREAHGDWLHAHGILFAPDVVLSAGALIRGALFRLEGRREPVAAIGERVRQAVAAILEQAAAQGLPPARVATDEADRRIDRWREEKGAARAR